MSKVLAKSNEDLKEIDKLLKKEPPSSRKAYSDRTAWLMACLSELAYIKFNQIFKGDQKSYLIKNVSHLLGEKGESSLRQLIESLGYNHDEEMKKLIEETELLKMKLRETFDSKGTEAILLENDNFIFLAFRGTEKSLNDIVADADAVITKCDTGGNIHRGFKKYFDHVSQDIQDYIDKDEFQEKPLFITGHSLGGALATIAAKKLTHRGGIAACYTFGSPRVGDEEWIANIKTPIYRLVNAADCVTMLPLNTELIDLLTWVLKFVPHIGSSAGSYLSKFSGYLHCGYMRFLTNCPGGDYEGVQLLYSVTFYYRIKGYIIQRLKPSKVLADHSISIYRKKLAIVARKRTIDVKKQGRGDQ